MKSILGSSCRVIPVASLLIIASTAWAAEPPPTEGANAAAPTPSAESFTPAATPVPAAANATAVQPTTPTATPTAVPVATAASTNSVEPSPYGSGGNEPPAANAAPAPKPKSDAPATLFDGSVDYAIGGFGGIGVMYTRFAGTDQPLVCGEGAVIIDHKFTLGGGGCGIASMMDASKYGGPAVVGEGRRRMTFGYGGAIIRYHFFSRNVANLAIGALIGAGGLQLGTYSGTGSEDNWDKYNNKHPDPVFVFEPQVGGYANLTRWLRIGAVGGFRFVSGVNTKGLSAMDLMGPTIGGQLQAGWF